MSHEMHENHERKRSLPIIRFLSGNKTGKNSMPHTEWLEKGHRGFPLFNLLEREVRG